MSEIQGTERYLPTQKEVEEAAERLEPEIEHWERAGFFVPDNEDQFGLDIITVKRAATEGVREEPQMELFEINDEGRQDTCTWRYANAASESTVIITQCGNVDDATDGTPEETNYEFCPYCGRPLEFAGGTGK